MKNRFAYLSSIIVIAVFATISMTQVSCKKDKDACDGVTCQHNGTCLDGTCACPTGYSGVNCETPYSSTYAGTYIGQDDQLNSDTVIITSDTSAYGVLINAKTKNAQFKGTLINDTLTIPSQSVTSGVLSYTVSGNGVFSLPNTRISYTIVSTSTTNITFTGRK